MICSSVSFQAVPSPDALIPVAQRILSVYERILRTEHHIFTHILMLQDGKAQLPLLFPHHLCGTNEFFFPICLSSWRTQGPYLRKLEKRPL